MACVSAVIMIAALAGCAGVKPAAPAPGRAAPQVAAFRFDNATPLADATDFTPWAELLADNAASESALDACLADKSACDSAGQLRYRRLLEIARDLQPR